MAETRQFGKNCQMRILSVEIEASAGDDQFVLAVRDADADAGGSGTRVVLVVPAALAYRPRARS